MQNRQGGLRTARLRFHPIPFTAISININCGKRRPSRPRPKGDGFRSPPKPPKPPAPAQPPVCHSPEKTVSSAKRISLRQRARRIIPLYKQGETVEGIAARLDLSVKTSFTGCNFTALSTLKAENQPSIFFLYMSLGFPPKKFKTFLAI